MLKNNVPDRWLMFDYSIIPTPVHCYSRIIFNRNTVLTSWLEFDDYVDYAKEEINK